MNLKEVSETQPRNVRHSLQCNDARCGTGAGPTTARCEPHLQTSGSLAIRPLIAGFGAGKTEDTILPSGIKSSVEDNIVEENKSVTFKILPIGRFEEEEKAGR
jgi:hypothetical protein